MNKKSTLEGEHEVRLKGRGSEREWERGRGRDCGGLAFEQEQDRVAGLLEKEGVSFLVIGNPKCLQLGWRVKEGSPLVEGSLPPPSSVTQDFVFVKQGADRRDQEGHLFV